MAKQDEPKHIEKQLEDHIPKYSQLREILHEMLTTLAPNQMIPSEQELCRMYNVSRTTVRKALDHMIYEGLLYRVPGKGTLVAPPKFRGRYIHSYFGFYEELTARGISFTTRVLQSDIVVPPIKIGQELNLNHGDKVFLLERVRSIGNEPIHHTYSYLPYNLYPGIEMYDFTNQSLFRVMREKYQMRIDHGIRLIEACPCTPEEAKILNIKMEVPLLIMTGTLTNNEKIPIEYGITIYRGDRSQLEVTVA